MKSTVYLFFFMLCLSCQNKAKNDAIVNSNTKTEKAKTVQAKTPLIQSLKQISLVKPATTYTQIKAQQKQLKRQLAIENILTDSLSKVFKTALLNHILPYWEGTPWSFEGHTAIPKKGTIACGYFVSTTLKDMGMNLNRYHLAQQSPINEAKSLAIYGNVKTVSEESVNKNIKAIDQYLKEGIHFIGFDQSHVGYILKEKEQLYLIHSNYINAVGVEIEAIEQSEVFKSYQKFYIVELSTNAQFLKYWLNNTVLQIQKG